MSLAGRGVVAIWNDIGPEARADFYEWHNREHMPERVAIPGFCRGRRYVAVDAHPEFFTLYETDGPDVLAGAAYLARLDNPTPWTRRASAAFVNVSRSLCSIALSLGTGQGGLIMTWRYAVVAGREDEQRQMLAERALPALAERPGIAGVHLCIADLAASSVPTAEKRLRSAQVLVPAWIILVEGASEVASLNAECEDALPDELLATAGAAGAIARGLYRLQYSRSRTAATPG